ncbi:MAG: phosphoribosyltransferase family protein, partial [Angelakisella sp.]
MKDYKSEDMTKILLSEQQIATAIEELGKRLTVDYAGREITVVGVLKGSVTFMVDLMRQIKLPLTIDFMSVSSYGSGVKTSG